MISERCSCGAEFHAKKAKWWLIWKQSHVCPESFETSGGESSTERAVEEQTIGFCIPLQEDDKC